MECMQRVDPVEPSVPAQAPSTAVDRRDLELHRAGERTSPEPRQSALTEQGVFLGLIQLCAAC